MKFAGVVVTFNRKNDLLINLNGILRQTRCFDRYYIVDNASNDGTYETLKENGYLDNPVLCYKRLPENIGGAGGFNTGIDFAYQDGFDFICLMDDDGYPLDENTLDRLYQVAVREYEKEKKLFINSLVVGDEKQEKLSFALGTAMTVSQVKDRVVDGVLKGESAPFNCTLISRELVAQIGFPNKDFFIRGDEVDYLSRARKVKACIEVAFESRYYHPAAELKEFRVMGHTHYIGAADPWKMYYYIRNNTYRLKRDASLAGIMKDNLFMFYGMLYHNPQKKTYWQFMWRGFWDGVHGRLGCTLKPGAKTLKDMEKRT